MKLWRGALLLGLMFVTVGVVYAFVQYGHPENWDFSGVTMLIILGVSMAFTFSVLLRGSRDL